MTQSFDILPGPLRETHSVVKIEIVGIERHRIGEFDDFRVDRIPHIRDEVVASARGFAAVRPRNPRKLVGKDALVVPLLAFADVAERCRRPLGRAAGHSTCRKW